MSDLTNPLSKEGLERIADLLRPKRFGEVVRPCVASYRAPLTEQSHLLKGNEHG